MKLKEEYIHLSESQRLYELDIPIVGLTGGIATGKSTISNLLTDKGIEIICADKLIKDIYKKPSTIEFIKKVSPQSVGLMGIDFSILRSEFFSNDDLKMEIEDFLYKELKKYFLVEAGPIREHQAFLVYDVPLLFEKKLESLFDFIIVAYTPRDIQFERVSKRDGNDPDVINNILDAQMDIELKKEKANYIITNTGSIDDLEKSVNQLIEDVFEASAPST